MVRDQRTKGAAQQRLAFELPRSWFRDVVRLEYTKDTGAFLSLGGGLSKELRILLFQAFSALWLVGLVLYLFSQKSPSMLLTVAWCLVLSGGAGNLVDRVLHDGRVVDFTNLGMAASAPASSTWPMSASPLELCY